MSRNRDLAAVFGVLLVAFAFLAAMIGFFAKHMGWESFFIFCAVIAVPGMLLLLKFAPWRAKKPIYVSNED